MIINNSIIEFANGSKITPLESTTNSRGYRKGVYFMRESISLDDGKYEIIFDQNDRVSEFYALRYGEEWRSLTGDNMVLCMFQRIKDLEEQLFQFINR